MKKVTFSKEEKNVAREVVVLNDEKVGVGEDGLGEMEKKEANVINPFIANIPKKKKRIMHLILETPKTVEKKERQAEENATPTFKNI